MEAEVEYRHSIDTEWKITFFKIQGWIPVVQTSGRWISWRDLVENLATPENVEKTRKQAVKHNAIGKMRLIISGENPSW